MGQKQFYMIDVVRLGSIQILASHVVEVFLFPVHSNTVVAEVEEFLQIVELIGFALVGHGFVGEL